MVPTVNGLTRLAAASGGGHVLAMVCACVWCSRGGSLLLRARGVCCGQWHVDLRARERRASPTGGAAASACPHQPHDRQPITTDTIWQLARHWLLARSRCVVVSTPSDSLMGRWAQWHSWGRPRATRTTGAKPTEESTRIEKAEERPAARGCGACSFDLEKVRPRRRLLGAGIRPKKCDWGEMTKVRALSECIYTIELTITIKY